MIKAEASANPDGPDRVAPRCGLPLLLRLNPLRRADRYRSASSSRSRSSSVLYRWKPTRTAPARTDARMPARVSSSAAAVGIETIAESSGGS